MTFFVVKKPLQLNERANGEFKRNRRTSRQDLIYLKKNGELHLKQIRRTYRDENVLKEVIECFVSRSCQPSVLGEQAYRMY